jgi:SAM-dependent methyltransferase
VLVVGPGAAEELPGLLAAMPMARFTLLEPSGQMAEFCRQQIASLHASSRCSLQQQSLAGSGLDPEGFEAVVCHHVLHLLPPQQQQQDLASMLSQLAPGGCLLLSSYSEPSGQENDPSLLEIIKARLRMLGMDEATLELFLSGRNKVVFSLAEELIQQQAQASGCAPPQVLLRAMFNGLWLIQRPAT